jgi:hypothetical protein
MSLAGIPPADRLSTIRAAIGKDDYFASGDGYLMPVKKDQPPPDLRYFKHSHK